jgi:hypothetical protein
MTSVAKIERLSTQVLKVVTMEGKFDPSPKFQFPPPKKVNLVQIEIQSENKR